MKLLGILAVTIAVVSSTTIPQPDTSETPLVENDTKTAPVITTASVRDVEIPAQVQEVDEDWTAQDDDTLIHEDDEEEIDNDSPTVEEEDDDIGEDDEDEDDYVDEDDEYEDDDEEASVDYDYEYEESVNRQDEFEANVPKPIHHTKDVIIHKDNFISVLKTIVLAYTHKEKPTYTDILKAGGLSAFKTGFKYFGKENLAANLLKMAKKLTGAFDEDDTEDINEKVMSELAEEYLASHRFKLVLPESTLLHKKEMEEFLATRDLEEMEGRSFVTNRQFDIAMPRADPAVHTVLTIGPMTWMALLGGLFSIPYFFSGSNDESARVDYVIPNPSPYLSAPGLPFFQTHQLRRDESEQVPHQQIDQEYLEYQQSYTEWYNNWYLRYKNYYDEHYPNHQQPPPQNFEQPQFPPHHHPELPPQHQPHLPPQPQPQPPLSSLDFMVPPPPIGSEEAKVPPPQKPLHPPQKPLPPKQQLPKQPPPIQFNTPIRPQVPLPNQRPRQDTGRHAASNILSSAETKPNTFGTFQSEGNKGDTHFRVIQGTETRQLTTPRSSPRVPSPQPVYIPTSETPKTERGFKPIIKPNSSTQNPSTTPSSKDKTEFSQPKDKTLLSSDVSSKTKVNPTSSDSKISGGFKPISAPSTPEKKPETSTIKVSDVTSGVFKTSTTENATPPSTTTSRPAVFVRTATQKSVRVVTSHSVVMPNSNKNVALPELKRPQRHQQSASSASSSLQQISNQVKTQQPLPVHQRLPLQQQAPPAAQNIQQQRPPVQQPRPVVVQHAIPVVTPQRPTPQQARPSVPQQNPAVRQQQQAQPSISNGHARPQNLNTGFVRTNVPTVVKVVDHRPAQGFGLGPKPEGEPTTTTTTTPVPIYALDPFYGSRLSRIDVIFHQLGVEGEGCREQVVCNIYKNPDVFTPYSDFLSRQLTVKLEELQRPKVSDERILRFFRYLKAAREGQDGSDCQSKYPECASDTTQLSHKPIMNAFQKVSLLMNAGSS